MKKWHFNKIDSCSNYKFNQSMTDFDKHGIAGLIRENIQNSSDARLNTDYPVLIKIKLKTTNSHDIPGIECLRERINSLRGMNGYSKKFILNMKNVISEEECKVITIEDLNTKGLSGATKKESPYVAYAYSKGYHAEEEDEEKEAQRGGSHGIGKIASNAASDIAAMFFVTLDEEGEKYIGGTCEFIDHSIDGKNYLGTGNFAKFDSNKSSFTAYENDKDGIFEKNTRGLKTIIPFIKDSFDNEKEIIKSICDSFFISIMNDALSIEVGNTKINKEDVKKILQDKEYYEQDIKKYKRTSNFTPLYYNTFVNGEKRTLEIEDKNNEKYEFNLYLSENDGLKSGRYSIVRTNGMKIAEKSIKGYAGSYFNVMLVAKSTKEDIFLKSLENEAHTQLSEVHIRDKKANANAKRFINNLDNEIKNVISKRLEELNPTDGKIDTSDIIYKLEHKFKEAGHKNKTAVKISNESDKDKKGKNESNDDLLLTKSTTGGYEVGNDGNINVDVHTEKKDNKSDIPRKTKGTDSTEEDKGLTGNGAKRERKVKENNKEKTFTKLTSSSVKRKINNKKEKLYLDLSGITELKNKKTCSLKISVIDGEGAELKEVNVLKNYKSIESNSNKLMVSNDKMIIEEVPITKGKINIDMSLDDNYDNNLKFAYEVVI